MKAIVGCVLLGLLAGLSHRETARWQSDVTLWTAAVRRAPLKPRPLVNLAAARMTRGNDPVIIAMQDEALRLAMAPWVPQCQRDMTAHVVAYNLFQIALASGNPDRIIPAFERLAIVWPEGAKRAGTQ